MLQRQSPHRVTRPTLPEIPAITPITWRNGEPVIDDMPDTYRVAPLFRTPSYGVSIALGVAVVAVLLLAAFALMVLFVGPQG